MPITEAHASVKLSNIQRLGTKEWFKSIKIQSYKTCV